MKKFIIDSGVSLIIIGLFIPLLCLSIAITIWEFTTTWPKNMISGVNDLYEKYAEEDT
tara:strand:+ start:96 stop:269 length:174 start_codon:yes stop_codon:yes gene_type:complete